VAVSDYLISDRDGPYLRNRSNPYSGSMSRGARAFLGRYLNLP
jgi:hypothetical protein